jgi:hypothetical protein
MEGGGEKPAPEAETRPGGRLPYEKPAVAWEQPLESQPSLMSGCAKVAGTEGDCSAVGPPSS